MPNFSIDGTRTKLTGTTSITTDLEVQSPTTNDTLNEIYLPVVIPDLDPPAFNVTAGLTAGSADVTGAAGAFTDVKVNDAVSAVSGLGTVTLGVPSTISLTSTTTTSGSPVLECTASLAAVKVGDALSGTGIPSSTYVKSIDSSTQITMTNNASASGTVTVTVAPLLRVSSKPSNSQIVLSVACGGTGTASSAVLSVDPQRLTATVYILRLQHQRSGNNLKVIVYNHAFNGTKAFDINGDGSDGVTKADAAAANVGQFSIDLDAYLTNARVPRVDD